MTKRNLQTGAKDMKPSKIPMNDLGRISAGKAEMMAAIESAFNSGWYINGPQNQKFCAEFAARIGVSHCVGVANGTDALHLAIAALLAKADAAKDAEVVTVANAGGYTSTACYAAGCVPVYCDITEDDHLICVDSALSAVTDRTICVVATHLFGGLVDVMALRRALDDAGFVLVAIIEDCAQAHGLEGPDGTAGSLGTLSTFSFYPTKNLGAMGDGGAVLTDDAELAEILSELRQYGWSRKYEIRRAGGMNSRLDDMQAAILRVKLLRLDEENARRREILDAYCVAVPDGLRVVRSMRGTVGHLAVIMVDDRAALSAHLTEVGIGTEIHYPILDIDQPGWAAQPGRVGSGNIDISRRCVTRILSVPCFAGMTDTEIEQVCAALRTYSGPEA